MAATTTFNNGLIDLFDFEVFNHNDYPTKQNLNLFTKIPNLFIKSRLRDIYKVDRILLVTFTEINRCRSHENISYLTIKRIMEYCDYKAGKNKTRIFYEIIKTLLFLKANKYISCDFDPYSISYNDLIRIEVIPENFDHYANFTKLYHNDFDYIMNSSTKQNKESILAVYLYICSYIGCRPRNPDGTETLPNPQDFPEAFFHSIKHMSKDLSMSKDTIYKCLDFLVKSENNRDGLLIKREISNVSFEDGQAPNIYVLNQNGYEQEIQWAIQKIQRASKSLGEIG